jgi:hypothetical protein
LHAIWFEANSSAWPVSQPKQASQFLLRFLYRCKYALLLPTEHDRIGVHMDSIAYPIYSQWIFFFAKERNNEKYMLAIFGGCDFDNLWKTCGRATVRKSDRSV